MRKMILFIFLVCIVHSMSAKQKFGTDIGIGIKGGMNFNKITGKGWKDQYYTDPHAGFFIYVNKKGLGVQLEAVWTQNHMTVDSSFYGLYHQYITQGTDSVGNKSFKFSTISLPFLLNIKLARFMWVQVGPQFSANVGVTDKDQIIKSGKNIIAQENYAAVGGLWFQFGLKPSMLRINAGVRYIAGLTDMNLLTNGNQWKNQMIQVHVGFGY